MNLCLCGAELHELKNACKERGLRVTGNKQLLIDRLNGKEATAAKRTKATTKATGANQKSNSIPEDSCVLGDAPVLLIIADIEATGNGPDFGRRISVIQIVSTSMHFAELTKH